MSAAKKAKITTVFPDKIDGVDKPLLQTLATVCQKLYDEKLYTSFKPKGGGESNEKLDQPFELIKKGGEYTDDAGEVISGVSIFNKDTKTTASIAEYGKVIDGITDFHGEFQAAFPPFAALIVQPKDETAVRSPTRGHPPVSLLRECCPLHPFSSPNERESAVRLCGRPPSSSSPGAGLSRCSTGSTMPPALPLSVGRPPAGCAHR